MELVSASKMRRAQESAFKGRDYRNLAQQILTRLKQLTDVSKHPLFEVRPAKARLYILITSDRGLAGAYNSSALKQFTKALTDDRDNGLKSYVITIGRQGSNFVGRLEHVESLGAYTNFPEQPDANDLRPVLNVSIEKFLSGEVDTVDIVFTDFRSSIVQEVTTQRLLPAAFEVVPVEADLADATFEPNPRAVLESVTQRLVESQLYQALLESFASEQSARMMAMKNASDNASDIIDDLTLAFNTARQAAITQELAEITGGAEAIA